MRVMGCTFQLHSLFLGRRLSGIAQTCLRCGGFSTVPATRRVHRASFAVGAHARRTKLCVLCCIDFQVHLTAAVVLFFSYQRKKSFADFYKFRLHSLLFFPLLYVSASYAALFHYTPQASRPQRATTASRAAPWSSPPADRRRLN